MVVMINESRKAGEQNLLAPNCCEIAVSIVMEYRDKGKAKSHTSVIQGGYV